MRDHGREPPSSHAPHLGDEGENAQTPGMTARTEDVRQGDDSPKIERDGNVSARSP